jgi:glycosyltransferase involved in cell wall biosynthesis
MLYLNFAKCLKQIVKQLNPNVIHLHTSNSVTLFVIADLLLKIKTPAIFTKKGISGKMSFLSLFKYNYKNINKIICVSKAVEVALKNVLKPKNHHKLCVVYDGIKTERSVSKNSIDLRKEFNILKESILVGNIANHSNAKDLSTFVKTADILINDLGVNNVHFIQIGREGKNTETFKPLIKEYGLEAFFTCTGFLENAMDLLPQLDVFLMTSEREGLPLTIYEAFLNKVPVVSTKAGGIPEAIEHDYNGLLAEVKDDRKLAANIKELIENSGKRKFFAERSYNLLFEKFTADQCAVNTLKVYEEAVN